MTWFDTVFNLAVTIAVYGFVLYLFWSAVQSILSRFKPKEPQEPQYRDSGGLEYE